MKAIITILTLVTATALGGNEGPGGGNSFLASSVDEARSQLLIAKRVLGSRDIEKVYEKSIQPKLKFELKSEKLYLNGSVTDAINYPKEGRIEFYEVTLKSLSPMERTRLIIHEFAGLAGVPDTNYSISYKAAMATDKSATNKLSTALQVCIDRVQKIGFTYVIKEGLKSFGINKAKEHFQKKYPQSEFVSRGSGTTNKFEAEMDNALVYFDHFKQSVDLNLTDGSNINLELKLTSYRGAVQIWKKVDDLGRPKACVLGVIRPEISLDNIESKTEIWRWSEPIDPYPIYFSIEDILNH